MLYVHKTFETCTPESLETGEPEFSGYEYENLKMTFKELVIELQDGGYCHLSSSEIDENTWITSEVDHNRDYFERGHETRCSLHLSSQSCYRAAKYWTMALNYVTTNS